MKESQGYMGSCIVGSTYSTLPRLRETSAVHCSVIGKPPHYVNERERVDVGSY